MATSSGGAGSPAGGGCKGGRRTAGEEDLLVHEGLALQSPDLMPHVLIEVGVHSLLTERAVRGLVQCGAGSWCVCAMPGEGRLCVYFGKGSFGGAGSAAGGSSKCGRRTAGEDDLLSGVHEGLALQSPDLMPHVLIEVGHM